MVPDVLVTDGTLRGHDFPADQQHSESSLNIVMLAAKLFLHQVGNNYIHLVKKGYYHIAHVVTCIN